MNVELTHDEMVWTVRGLTKVWFELKEENFPEETINLVWELRQRITGGN